MPRWCLWLLRFQIALPYVFGGIAKLNVDWLAGEPMSLWLSRMAQLKPYAPFLDEAWVGVVASDAALLFDLAVVPALLWKPTRLAAFVAAVTFHVLNSLMFRIGIFPWMMIAATTLFLSPDWPRRAFGRGHARHHEARAEIRPMSRVLAIALAVWVSVQLLLPLRHLAYPGRVDWNERGSRFAWRMMVRDKASVLQFIVTDRASGRTRAIDPRSLLTTSQITRMGQYPDMLRQFAGFLSRSLAVPGSPAPEVHVVSLVSLNGRKPQPLVVPEVDLADPAHDADWIQPLTEPLPDTPWLVPMHEWARRVFDEGR
jgi:hypothetical protein